ncbi:hypothetical protein ACFLTS_06665 [Chloroflexota bacterium]
MYEVVWPRGNKTTETTSFAKRLDTLEGKTIGELWNWVFRGDEIFPAMEKEMSKRYPGIKFASYETFGSMHGGEEGKALEDLPDKLKQNKCDAIVAGVGC